MSRYGGGRGAPCERDGAMWLCACALALLCAALAHADTRKRAEMSAVPFVMGSRYGRSSPRLITPRNDRFFMGSRYGKRSEMSARGDASGEHDTQYARHHPDTPSGGRATLAARHVQPAAVMPQERSVGSDVAPTLLCEYTGVYPVYRCVPPHEYIQYSRRSSDAEAGPGGGRA